MNDIKRIDRSFLLCLIGFILMAAALVFCLIAVNIWIENVKIQTLLYFILLIASLIVVSVFKTVLERITQISFLIKIRAHPGDPLPMNHTRSMDSMGEHMVSLGYERSIQDLNHALYFRIAKEEVKRIFRRYTLEVVVLIEPHNTQFYLDQVDQEIHNLQQASLKKGKKIVRMLITQIKEINELDDATKTLIKEIIFVRTNQTVISTINVGLYRSLDVAVMLYSDTYHPSLYYVQHINSIKKII